MTMHRVDVSPRFGMSANGRSQPTPSGASVANAAVCEWSFDLDLDLGAATPVIPDRTTSLASAGFVDFDAIESVHTSSVGTSWR